VFIGEVNFVSLEIGIPTKNYWIQGDFVDVIKNSNKSFPRGSIWPPKKWMENAENIFFI